MVAQSAPDWDVHITNVTAGHGAMNLAGPKSRDVLRKLTDCDLNSSSFPYMACREAQGEWDSGDPVAHWVCR